MWWSRKSMRSFRPLSVRLGDRRPLGLDEGRQAGNGPEVLGNEIVVGDRDAECALESSHEVEDAHGVEHPRLEQIIVVAEACLAGGRKQLSQDANNLSVHGSPYAVVSPSAFPVALREPPGLAEPAGGRERAPVGATDDHRCGFPLYEAEALEVVDPRVAVDDGSGHARSALGP